MRRPLLAGLLVCLAAVSCKGDAPEPEGVASAPAIGLRRLSTVEYQTTVRDLLDVEVDARSRLPEDPRDPFDNDYTLQSVSAVHIEGYEALGTQAADAVLADEKRRAALVGCDPTTEQSCLSSFTRTFGRRALRRPLADDEVTRLVTMATTLADAAGDPWVGPEIVLRTLLQHTEFLYRVEVGEPVTDDVVALNDYEIVTRMAYLLWGTAPDEALLDRAAAGGLNDPEARKALAADMLGDARARDQINRFHALWLGYIFLLPDGELSGALRREADALVGDVVFDTERAYLELFTAPQTFVEPSLADHYGWERPTEAAWVDFPEEGRSGLLGTGAFLAVAAKFGDTSPTQRGKLIRERLMCEFVEPPPPSVNVDDPPESSTSDCKIDRYSEHRAGGCQGCHLGIDEVGFGLEAWDQTGRFREHDAGHPECLIDYGGEITELGPFRGPGALAELLIDNDVLDVCAVTQVYRYAIGRRDRAEDSDQLDTLTNTFREGGHRFGPMLVDLVAAPEFVLRRQDEVTR